MLSEKLSSFLLVVVWGISWNTWIRGAQVISWKLSFLSSLWLFFSVQKTQSSSSLIGSQWNQTQANAAHGDDLSWWNKIKAPISCVISAWSQTQIRIIWRVRNGPKHLPPRVFILFLLQPQSVETVPLPIYIEHGNQRWEEIIHPFNLVTATTLKQAQIFCVLQLLLIIMVYRFTVIAK